MIANAQHYMPEKLGFVIGDAVGPTIVTYRVGSDGISPTVGIIHWANGPHKGVSGDLAPPKHDASAIIAFYEELLAADRNGTLTLDLLVEKVTVNFGSSNQANQPTR